MNKCPQCLNVLSAHVEVCKHCGFSLLEDTKQTLPVLDVDETKTTKILSDKKMPSESRQKVKVLFKAAVGVSPKKRLKFLQNACGNDRELQREVGELLSSYEASDDSFLEEPAANGLASLILEQENPGKTTGGFLTQNFIAGTVLDKHYRIISLLGKGGMGKVYLAQDKKLNRQVALKILPADFANDGERMSRFVREAQSASALNHPNIITIYEINEIDDLHFISTEYIKGKTLTEYVKTKPLKISSVLDIAIQVASALGAAHKAGIVHRDIKPDNIMVRKSGLVKILDFGIAQLSEPPAVAGGLSSADSDDNDKPAAAADGSDSSEIQINATPGMIIGTPDYMSPEQAAGKPVDTRSDIFSLGVVLYEMISGRNPFAGDSVLESLANLINSEPPLLDRIAENVPDELNRIVAKTLRKKRDERYQAMKDLLADLEGLRENLMFDELLEKLHLPDAENKTQKFQAATNGTKLQIAEIYRNFARQIKRHQSATLAVLTMIIAVLAVGGYFAFFAPHPPITSIAVLPFVNGNNDANLDYLSDGLSESLIDRLSQLPQLKVIARSSSFKFRGENIDIQDVANKLGVQAIVMGKVIQRGNDLTIAVEMIDVRENKQLWGERYKRKATDIVLVQKEITHMVAEKLRLRLTDNQETQLAKKETSNPEAYRLYMKGKLIVYRNRNKTGLSDALEYFEQANALDPNFALPYVEIASMYRLEMWGSTMDTQVAKSKARAALQKALEIDPILPEVYFGLAEMDFFEFNFSKAEKGYKKAIELNPNFASSYGYYAIYLARVGRYEEASEQLKKLYQLDPMERYAWKAEEGHQLLMARRYEDAIQLLTNLLEIDPKNHYVHAVLGYTYSAKGMYKEAIAEYQKAIEILTDGSTLIYLGAAYAKAGETDKARAILKDMETTEEYVSPAELAVLYAALSDEDKAFQTLERAYAARDFQLINLNADAGYDSLRDDPRFKDLLRRVGLPQ